MFRERRGTHKGYRTGAGPWQYGKNQERGVIEREVEVARRSAKNVMYSRDSVM